MRKNRDGPLITHSFDTLLGRENFQNAPAVHGDVFPQADTVEKGGECVATRRLWSAAGTIFASLVKIGLTLVWALVLQVTKSTRHECALITVLKNPLCYPGTGTIH